MHCEVCGSDYHKTFRVIIDDTTRIFDSFECAIHALAPRCEHCDCRVIGHGVEVEGCIFCCEHCAAQGARRERDPVELASEDSFPASDPPAWTVRAADPPGAQVTSMSPRRLQTAPRRSGKPPR
jgi:hypothetical protein